MTAAESDLPQPPQSTCTAELIALFRNDDEGIHWLPESILHVSEVTDDQV